VRAYRRGDPLKLIAWKKAAQALETGAELVSRDTSTSSRHELWLDWTACGRLAPEQRGHLVPLQAMHACFWPAIHASPGTALTLAKAAQPWLRSSAAPGLMLATQKLDGIT
jgi:hypothetical protein